MVSNFIVGVAASIVASIIISICKCCIAILKDIAK